MDETAALSMSRARGQIVNPRMRIVPMIGHPIAQVITPEPMNRWFTEHALDAAIVPMDIGPQSVADFFRMVRGWHNCSGVSITMPHKQAAFVHCDTASLRAQQAQAANLIVRSPDGALHGDMTDGVAFVGAIRAKGFQTQGARLVLIGAGGAGAAVAHAMAEAGAAVIHIVEIDPARRDALRAALMQHHDKVLASGSPDESDPIDIVFNATPLGMTAQDPLPYDLIRLSPACLIADAVTKPLLTPFIVNARAHGHDTLTGEEMALAQLPIQLPLWGFPYTDGADKTPDR